MFQDRPEFPIVFCIYLGIFLTPKSSNSSTDITDNIIMKSSKLSLP